MEAAIFNKILGDNHSISYDYFIPIQMNLDVPYKTLIIDRGLKHYTPGCESTNELMLKLHIF